MSQNHVKNLFRPVFSKIRIFVKLTFLSWKKSNFWFYRWETDFWNFWKNRKVMDNYSAHTEVEVFLADTLRKWKFINFTTFVKVAFKTIFSSKNSFSDHNWENDYFHLLINNFMFSTQFHVSNCQCPKWPPKSIML